MQKILIINTEGGSGSIAQYFTEENRNGKQIKEVFLTPDALKKYQETAYQLDDETTLVIVYSHEPLEKDILFTDGERQVIPYSKKISPEHDIPSLDNLQLDVLLNKIFVKHAAKPNKSIKTDNGGDKPHIQDQASPNKPLTETEKAVLVKKFMNENLIGGEGNDELINLLPIMKVDGKGGNDKITSAVVFTGNEYKTGNIQLSGGEGDDQIMVSHQSIFANHTIYPMKYTIHGGAGSDKILPYLSYVPDFKDMNVNNHMKIKIREAGGNHGVNLIAVNYSITLGSGEDYLFLSSQNVERRSISTEIFDYNIHQDILLFDTQDMADHFMKEIREHYDINTRQISVTYNGHAYNLHFKTSGFSNRMDLAVKYGIYDEKAIFDKNGDAKIPSITSHKFY